MQKPWRKYLAYSVEAGGGGTPHLAFLAFAVHLATLLPTMTRAVVLLPFMLVLLPVEGSQLLRRKQWPSPAKL
jgi:hypothetical protein